MSASTPRSEMANATATPEASRTIADATELSIDTRRAWAPLRKRFTASVSRYAVGSIHPAVAQASRPRSAASSEVCAHGSSSLSKKPRPCALGRRRRSAALDDHRIDVIAKIRLAGPVHRCHPADGARTDTDRVPSAPCSASGVGSPVNAAPAASPISALPATQMAFASSRNCAAERPSSSEPHPTRTAPRQTAERTMEWVVEDFMTPLDPFLHPEHQGPGSRRTGRSSQTEQHARSR